MSKQFEVFSLNILKLIGIMYIAIGLKNILQLLLGTLFNSEHDAKVYKLINLDMRSTLNTKLGLIELMLMYDFIVFVFIAYLWIYLILYLIINLTGNRFWFQLLYPVIVYFTTILFIEFNPNILFILITLILGFTNWWLFKKWIK